MLTFIYFVLFIICIFIINKVYKNHIELKKLKTKYEILSHRYEYAISGSKIGLWDWDLKTNEVYFSKEWKEMLGYSDDELANDLAIWDEKVHPDDKEKAYFDIKQNQLKNTDYYENIHRLKHKNGSWVWILDKGQTIFDKNNNAIRMVGIHMDITKLEELKIEVSKLKKVIEHSPISIVITDIKGIIEYVNPCFCKTSGYTQEEVIGQNPRVLKSEYTSSNEYQTLWNTLIKKKTWIGRFKNKKKDGSDFWESAIITPIFDDNNEIVNFLAVKQEITKEIYLKEEIKNKEEMMIAQSRHAAMGEMISMIAHQWRQPISVISMASNNILADIQLDMLDNEELKENIEETLEQTKYLSQTIEDFRNFFRPNKDKELINPLCVINDTLSIMDKSLLNSSINVNITCKEDLSVLIYSRELLQVFMNIIKNAKESFLNKNIKDKNIEISILKKQNIVRIEIYNNAGPIEDKIKDNIFDPYFTTKDEKTGTGLGLYMCKTIVEKHLNGELGFYNSRDGVCFYVDLPLFKEKNK